MMTNKKANEEMTDYGKAGDIVVCVGLVEPYLYLALEDGLAENRYSKLIRIKPSFRLIDEHGFPSYYNGRLKKVTDNVWVYNAGIFEK